MFILFFELIFKFIGKEFVNDDSCVAKTKLANENKPL